MANVCAPPKVAPSGVSDDFVCPPPDEGLWSIVYRLRAFPPDVTTWGVGLVDLATLALLVGCVHAVNARPKALRWMRNGAFGLAGVATVPFVGAVAIGGGQTLMLLIRTGWGANPYVVRNLVCCPAILLLGLMFATAPFATGVLAHRRLNLAGHAMALKPLRRWAAGTGALLAVQFAWAGWGICSYSVQHALWYFWQTPNDDAYLMGAFAAIVTLGALALIIAAPVVVPLRAAKTRTPSASPPHPFTDPSRFAPNHPVNLHT